MTVRLHLVGWSMRALLACIVCEAATAWILSDGWEAGSYAWLVFVVPLVLAVPPVLVASRALRIATAAAAVLWCLATLAIVTGLFFAPWAALMVVAAAAPGDAS
jgi:hypothetical protein